MQHLKEKKIKFNVIKFADHYNYTTKDIQYILSKYKSSISDKNIILTTEKDKVKLTKFKEEFKGVKLYFVPVKTEIHKSREFNNEILKYVRTNKREC